MKKVIAILLSAMLLLACVSTFAESEGVQTGHYHFYNSTGEKVTAIYLIDKPTSTVSENFAGEGLEPGADIEVTYEAPNPTTAHGTLLLIFITESGYVGTFVKLSVEDAPIQLLSAEAMTGATMIDFHAPAAE